MIIHLSSSSTFVHHSIHDEFMSDKNIQSVNSRILQSQSNFRKMRIKFDYTLADTFVRQTNSQALSDKLKYMKIILQTTENYFEERIQVDSPESMNINIRSCFGKPWSSDLKENVEEDLVILINPFNERTGFFAAAGACAIDGQTGRPIAGALFLNFLNINLTEINKFYLPSVFIHEVLHIMGFSSGFFRRQNMVEQLQFGDKTMFA